MLLRYLSTLPSGLSPDGYTSRIRMNASGLSRAGFRLIRASGAELLQ